MINFSGALEPCLFWSGAPEPRCPGILSPEPRSPKPLWNPDMINNYIILVTILTTCLFRQNKFDIYFNCHSDSDECMNNSHNCSENATCTNTEGSFNCSCKPGYIGNGHNCSGWFLKFLSRFPLVLRLLVQYEKVNVNFILCTTIIIH